MTVSTTPVYELWDVEAGNMIGHYPDEPAALRAIREGANEDGLESWGPVALLRIEPDGRDSTVAQGLALVARALQRSDGTFNLAGHTFDAAQLGVAIFLIDAVTKPEFYAAVRDVRVALTEVLGQAMRDLEPVRAAVGRLSQTAGVPVRVTESGAMITLVTPDRMMAGLLAVGVQRDPAPRNLPVRTVADGFAVDIAA